MTYGFDSSYYSKTLGYVVDGHHFGHDPEEAMRYLIHDAFMERDDAASYMDRLVRDYRDRVARAERALA